VANDLVPRQGGSVEYYSPSSGRVVEVHHHYHHYITVQQPKNEDGSLTALKAIGGILGGIGALVGAFAALNGANRAPTLYQQYLPQQQQEYQYQIPRYVPPPPRGHVQQRREYVGTQVVGREFIRREILYQERTPYGTRTHYRDVYRNRYEDQYRTRYFQVCE